MSEDVHERRARVGEGCRDGSEADDQRDELRRRLRDSSRERADRLDYDGCFRQHNACGRRRVSGCAGFVGDDHDHDRDDRRQVTWVT